MTPNLWFDKEAKDAADFYASIFKDSKIKSIATLHDTPSGDTDIVTIELFGQEFTLISAGPLFKVNPSVSFLVACRSKEETDAYYAELSKGGSVLMELSSYPFSERYAWVIDKYGLSWQLMAFGNHPIGQKIIPIVMFVGKIVGKAEEAMNFYVSVFHNSAVGEITRYGKGEEPDREGTVKHGSYTLEGQEFGAMDSALEHNFAFNEATSFIVHCETQEEIDYYWNKLSADPKAEICGWLKDKYGFSWQVTPNILDQMINDKDDKKVARVTEAFLKMKKLDIAALEKAFRGDQV
ncbi:MAG TPA: VOC family protein [Candidatus Deferrimicrobiaceae bacterium]|nr:VOC family protein [Candidatus Deferrimicrobiaceae bacterium]